MTMNLEGKLGLERKFWLREMGGWLYSNSLIPVRRTLRQPARLLPPVMPAAQDARLQSRRSRQGDRPLFKLQWRPQCAGEKMKWRWGSQAGRCTGWGLRLHAAIPDLWQAHTWELFNQTQDAAGRNTQGHRKGQSVEVVLITLRVWQTFQKKKKPSGKYFHFVVTLLFHSDTTN